MTTETLPIAADARAARWLRGHPRIVDAVLLALAAALPLLGLAITRDWVCLPQVLVAVPLWWRRRAPFLVLAAVSALAAAASVVSDGPVATGAALAIAVSTVAATQTTARTILGYVVAVGLPTLATGAQALVTGDAFSPGLLDPVLLIGLAVGFAVRAARERRLAVAALVKQRTAQAVHAERARIAAEMHDVVAHSLTVMVALAGGARTAWNTHPARARDALEQLGGVGATALDDMQRILRLLRTDEPDRDAPLQDSGLDLPSLDELVQTFRTAGLPVALHRSGPVRHEDPALDTTVHRIIQEALTNALRYATGASEVRVDVVSAQDALSVRVTDDGRPDAAVPSVGAGSGVISIRTRAESFGGTATAGPRAGGGWEVRAVLPRAPRGDDPDG